MPARPSSNDLGIGGHKLARVNGNSTDTAVWFNG
jgi:hypothetical protein